MGVMTGKILKNEFVVMDAIPLPVEGTETRVNAMAAGYEYMVNYVTSLQRVGRKENVVGWYHSHPGYGCWLSGIDVGTQRQSQLFQDPFLALVIDPNRTIAAGKVEIGAFRTYPLNQDGQPIKNLKGSLSSGSSKSVSIPSSKIKDFGVHANFYYQLEISYFKSSLDSKLLDLLWNKYWTSTLSQSPLLANFDYSTHQIQDLALKTDAAAASLSKKLMSFQDFHTLNQNVINKGSMDKSSIGPFDMEYISDYSEDIGIETGNGGGGKGGGNGGNSGGKSNESRPSQIPHYALLGTAISNFKVKNPPQSRPSSHATPLPTINDSSKKSETGNSEDFNSNTNNKKKPPQSKDSNRTSLSSSSNTSSNSSSSSKRSTSSSANNVKLPNNIVIASKLVTISKSNNSDETASSADSSSSSPSSSFSNPHLTSISQSSSSQVTVTSEHVIDAPVRDAVQCAVRTGNDQLHGFISQELRDQLFLNIQNHNCKLHE